MTTQHTPGRVSVRKPRKAHRTNALMFGISGLETVDDWEDWGFNEADARRLVACWNACEGIATEMLESVCKVPPAVVMLAEQRDELLSLLSEVSENFTCEDDLPTGLLSRIDAAIAKAEGKA